jgi:hypothetical protein
MIRSRSRRAGWSDRVHAPEQARAVEGDRPFASIGALRLGMRMVPRSTIVSGSPRSGRTRRRCSTAGASAPQVRSHAMLAEAPATASTERQERAVARVRRPALRTERVSTPSWWPSSRSSRWLRCRPSSLPDPVPPPGDRRGGVPWRLMMRRNELSAGRSFRQAGDRGAASGGQLERRPAPPRPRPPADAAQLAWFSRRAAYATTARLWRT